MTLCVRLPIPPLPQLLTVGYSTWSPGSKHFSRSFPVFDLLVVTRGMLYMKEDDIEYEIGPGTALLLEANRSHEGYHPCSVDTSIYWVHFRHHEPAILMQAADIPWSGPLRRGTDTDTAPTEQWLFLPKFGAVDLTLIVPLLDRMCRLHLQFSVENTPELHALLAQLLAVLQSSLRQAVPLSLSEEIARRAAEDLLDRYVEPFSAAGLAARLNYHFDYISRCMKRHVGCTPLQYVQKLRLEKAKHLLQHTDEPIQHIAAWVGMVDTNYFCRFFRQQMGESPQRYRLSQRVKHGM